MPNPTSRPKRLVYRDLREEPRLSAARYRPIIGILLSAFWDEIYREGRNTRLTSRRSTEDKPPGLSGQTAPGCRVLPQQAASASAEITSHTGGIHRLANGMPYLPILTQRPEGKTESVGYGGLNHSDH